MELLYLGLVFGAIVVLLALRRPLYQAILGGLLLTAVLFRLPVETMLVQTGKVFTQWNSLSVLISLYLITYLQRMLEAREQIKLAQRDLNGLFHNRRINAAGAALFIGLLPSAAAMLLCSEIVKDATEGYLERDEQAFVTSWMRHIPESTLPTYSGVLLMMSISGLPLPQFMVQMIAPTIALALIGYLPYLRRIPTDPGTPRSENRRRDALGLFQHLWSLLAILLLILVFGLSVVPATFIVIIISAAAYRFKLSELVPMLKSAFETKLIFNSFLVLVLKEFIACTGALQLLPEKLALLPVPAWLIFSLLFLLAAIISGANGSIALGTPLVMAAMAVDVPLMVLLMCMAHAGSQLSPVHVCLVVASDYFEVPMGKLIRRTVPAALLFCVLVVGYYLLLTML